MIEKCMDDFKEKALKTAKAYLPCIKISTDRIKRVIQRHNIDMIEAMR